MQKINLGDLSNKELSTTKDKPKRIPIWLDCDPGHDDAMAIILAGHDPRLKLIGLSSVAGNMDLEKTTKNILDIINISGLEKIPVARG